MKKRNNNTTINTEAAFAVLIGFAMFVIYITFMFVGMIEDDKILTSYMLIRIVMSFVLISVGEGVILSTLND